MKCIGKRGEMGMIASPGEPMQPGKPAAGTRLQHPWSFIGMVSVGPFLRNRKRDGRAAASGSLSAPRWGWIESPIHLTPLVGIPSIEAVAWSRHSIELKKKKRNLWLQDKHACASSSQPVNYNKYTRRRHPTETAFNTNIRAFNTRTQI